MGYEKTFPARELKPYAVPVETDQLKVGEIYFSVQFSDRECFVPTFAPKVFIGRDLDPKDQGIFYFQDYGAHRQGLSYDDDSEEAGVWRCQTVKHLFSYENGLNVLLQCSLRRVEAGR
jgi:hypothetical protein